MKVNSFLILPCPILKSSPRHYVVIYTSLASTFCSLKSKRLFVCTSLRKEIAFKFQCSGTQFPSGLTLCLLEVERSTTKLFKANKRSPDVGVNMTKTPNVLTAFYAFMYTTHQFFASSKYLGPMNRVSNPPAAMLKRNFSP